MDLNSIIFTLTINLIKLILKELIPYFKFILFIIAYIKPILALALISLLIIIVVILTKKYKQHINSNNLNSPSTLKRIDINNSKKCSESSKEINSTFKESTYCENQFKKNNLALIFTGISLLINPICIFSILGIIFGIIQLTDNDNKTEKSWTIVSIIVSILITILWIFILKNNF